MKKWVLKGKAGPVAGQEFILEDKEYLIGRGSTADIIIQDPGVSRRHARLIPYKDSFIIEDLNSFNGTFINGKRIQTHLLKPKDTIIISRTTLVFETVEEDKRGINIITEDDDELEVSGTIDATQILKLWGSDSSLPIKSMDQFTRKLKAFSVMSEALITTFRQEELFEKVLDQILDIFPKADRVTILLKDKDTGRLEVKAIKYSGEKQLTGFEEGISLSQTVIQQVMEKGHAILAQPSPGSISWNLKKPRSRMGAPLMFQGEIIGIFHIDSFSHNKAFDESDLDLLTSIAAQISMALQISQMHEKILQQKFLEKDLQLARKIQRGFLPKRLPRVPNVTFSVHYESANAVGGDFYDFIELDQNRIAIVIGDISGHGISAALFMAKVLSDLRSYILSLIDPQTVFSKMYELISENEEGMFATAVYMILDLKERRLTIANAGHNPPYIRKADGTLYILNQHINLAFGVLPEVDIEFDTIRLDKGDTIVLYTDGIVEAKDENGEEFGNERLASVVVKSNDCNEVIQNLLLELELHVGERGLSDDITIVTFTIK